MTRRDLLLVYNRHHVYTIIHTYITIIRKNNVLSTNKRSSIFTWPFIGAQNVVFPYYHLRQALSHYTYNQTNVCDNNSLGGIQAAISVFKCKEKNLAWVHNELKKKRTDLMNELNKLFKCSNITILSLLYIDSSIIAAVHGSISRIFQKCILR